MIVAIAAGQQPRLTWDPLVPIETMTAYIVQVSLGDTPQGTLEYRTIFAVGMLLFLETFALNLVERLAARALPRGVRVMTHDRRVGFASAQSRHAASALLDAGAFSRSPARPGAGAGGAGALLVCDVARRRGRLSWDFLTGFPSRRAEEAGIWHALAGSIFVIALTGALAGADRRRRGDLPGGVRRPQLLARLIEINITNLAAVPSIIYGLLGLGLFVRMMGMGRSVLAGASTLALLVLPVVILSTREALRAVPSRCAKGRTRWARRSGRRSGTRCCRWRCRVS